MTLSTEVNEDTILWKGELGEADIRRIDGQKSVHGPWVGLEVAGHIPGQEVGLRIEFRLLEESPLLLWRVQISNHGKLDLKLLSLDLLRVSETGDRSSGLSRWLDGLRKRRQRSKEGGDFWFMDGWQSWSFAGALVDENIITGTRLGPATKPMYLNPSSNHRGRVSEMFGVIGNRADQAGWLIGQLSERQAFGSLHAQPSRERTTVRLTNPLDGIALRPEGTFTTDWAAVQALDLSQREPNAAYLEAVATENQARRDAETPVGWCSWYYFFEDVTERDVRDHVEWIEKNRDSLPLQIVQIDDGYQREIGDWLEKKETFPSEHRLLVEGIEDAGLTPGLWLAPFIAVPDARIVAEHPEWVLRNERGRPVRAGYNWGTFFIALDLTNPEVIEYIKKVVHTAVSKWGYRYLKLDFLYAGALAGKRWDPKFTRAQALRAGLQAIREAAGEKTFLAGCGCPLGPAIGLVDSMRIGPDVAPRWLPAYQGIEFYFHREPSLPSLRNAMQNTLTRAPLHRCWWINDPDCLLLRGSDTHLSEDEVRLMATVGALSGGSMVLSDDLLKLSEERLAWATKLLPPLGSGLLVPDQFERLRPEQMVFPLSGVVGDWVLFACINWSESARRMQLDASRIPGIDSGMMGVDFWQEKLVSFKDVKWEMNVPGHGVRLLQLRRVPDHQPVWLGDTLHISGGRIVTGWKIGGDTLTADLHLGRRGSGKIWLKLPRVPKRASFRGESIDYRICNSGVSRFDLSGIRGGDLVVHW